MCVSVLGGCDVAGVRQKCPVEWCTTVIASSSYMTMSKFAGVTAHEATVCDRTDKKPGTRRSNAGTARPGTLWTDHISNPARLPFAIAAAGARHPSSSAGTLHQPVPSDGQPGPPFCLRQPTICAIAIITDRGIGRAPSRVRAFS